MIHCHINCFGFIEKTDCNKVVSYAVDIITCGYFRVCRSVCVCSKVICQRADICDILLY